MKYHVIHIRTSFAQEWEKDLFDQALCDLGVDTIDGENYYIPSERLAHQLSNLQSQISNTEGAMLLGMEACPDENWNAVWESEHPIEELPLGIRIVPHCAFGAGHHETTSMMIRALLSADLQGKAVVDHGTGTGVLAIFAKRLGAASVLAIDIDDKSVVNARENAALNGVEIEVMLNDSIPLPARDTKPTGIYDLVLANIHRNILLANMPVYAAVLKPGGELWLSGFYEEDNAALIESAQQRGLQLVAMDSDNSWQLLRFRLSGANLCG